MIKNLSVKKTTINLFRTQRMTKYRGIVPIRQIYSTFIRRSIAVTVAVTAIVAVVSFSCLLLIDIFGPRESKAYSNDVFTSMTYTYVFFLAPF